MALNTNFFRLRQISLEKYDLQPTAPGKLKLKKYADNVNNIQYRDRSQSPAEFSFDIDTFMNSSLFDVVIEKIVDFFLNDDLLMEDDIDEDFAQIKNQQAELLVETAD